jgi:fumarate reductase subunit C
MGALRHSDTTLWYVQVITGFSLFFLVSAHLYIVFTQPENIGPYASSDRVWTQRFWILYAPLLAAVHVHAGVGIYRLAIKWGPAFSGNFQAVRARLKIAMWCIIVFFITLGTVTLVTYMKIGSDHAERAGERFVPASENAQAGH